jgi:uncharacterized phiE125 gp8 family phage protein
MRAGMVLITPPTVEPVTLTQAKAHLRVDISDDDQKITDLIVSARAHIEALANLALLTQTWDQIMDDFPYPNYPIELNRWPVQSIGSIKYTSAANITSTWPSTNYIANLANIPPRVAPVYAQFWPILALQTIGNCTIRTVNGWTDASIVPPDLKQAVLMLVADWYEDREDELVGVRIVSVKVQRGIDELLAPYKASQFVH